MGPKKRVANKSKIAKVTKNSKATGKKLHSKLRQTRLQVAGNELIKVSNARLRELQRSKHELLKTEAELKERNNFLYRKITRYANPDQWELKEREEYENILLPMVNQWKELFGFDFSSVKNYLECSVVDTEHTDTWSLKFSYGEESYSLSFAVQEKEGSHEIMDVSVSIVHPRSDNVELKNILDDCAKYGRLADIFFVIIKYETLKLTRQQIVDELTEKWEDSGVFHSKHNEEIGALEIFIGPKESFLFKVTVKIEENSMSGERLIQTSSIEYGIGGVRQCQSAGYTDDLIQQKLKTDLFGLLKDLLKVAELTD